MASKQLKFIFHRSGGGSPRPSYQQIHCLVRVSFLVQGRLPFPWPRMAEGESKLSESTDPIREGGTLMI